MGQHEAEPRADRASDPGPRAVRARMGLGRADRQHGQRRAERGDRPDAERRRRAEELHEHAAEGWTGGLGSRLARAERAVARQEVLARHDRREERLVGHDEEERGDPGQEGDEVELGEVEPPECRRRGDRREHPRPREVGPEEQGPPPAPVDQGPGEEAEEERRGRLGGGQQADLDRRRPEADRRQREGQQGRLDADEGDRVAAPERAEGGGRPEGRGTCGHSSSRDRHPAGRTKKVPARSRHPPYPGRA